MSRRAQVRRYVRRHAPGVVLRRPPRRPARRRARLGPRPRPAARPPRLPRLSLPREADALLVALAVSWVPGACLVTLGRSLTACYSRPPRRELVGQLAAAVVSSLAMAAWMAWLIG